MMDPNEILKLLAARQGQPQTTAPTAPAVPPQDAPPTASPTGLEGIMQQLFPKPTEQTPPGPTGGAASLNPFYRPGGGMGMDDVKKVASMFGGK